MFEVVLHRQVHDPAGYRGKPVTTAGMSELPLGTVVRTPAGQPLLAYVRMWEPDDPLMGNLRAELHQVKFHRDVRTNGLVTQNEVFGRMGRSLPRRDHRATAGLDTKHPGLALLLHTIGAQLEHRYATLAPVTFAHHVAQAGRVLPEWRMPGLSCFTGGVVNKDAAIGWHHDAGNFKATFSAMPVVRNGMDGGALCVPELGYYVPAEDGTCVFFDGQSLLHGVTPMTKRWRSAYRYSIVFYSAVKLWQCLPPTEEVQRAQGRRTERELRRAQGGQANVTDKERAALARSRP